MFKSGQLTNLRFVTNLPKEKC